MGPTWYIEEASRKLDEAVQLVGALECSYHKLVREVVNIMQSAKTEKNYMLSDALRAALAGAGIDIEPNTANMYLVDQYKLRKLFADNLEARGINT